MLFERLVVQGCVADCNLATMFAQGFRRPYPYAAVFGCATPLHYVNGDWLSQARSQSSRSVSLTSW